MSATHNMARTVRERSAHDEQRAEDLGSLDASLSQLEAKLAALQSRGLAPTSQASGNAPHVSDGAPQAPSAPQVQVSATPRRVRVGAPSLDPQVFAVPGGLPEPHHALKRLEQSFSPAEYAPTAPSAPVPSAATAEPVLPMIEAASREATRGMEALGREIAELRREVSASGERGFDDEFSRVYRGLEAVADALDRQDEGALATDLAAIRRNMETIGRKDATRDETLGKIVQSQSAVLQAQTAVERALANHRGALDPELASIRTQIEDVARRIGDNKNAAAIEGLDRRLVALGKTLGEVKRVAGEGPDLRALEAKLEDLARVVVAAAQSVPEIDVAPIERIEARVASHHRRVDERDKRREQIDARRADEMTARLDALASESREAGASMRAVSEDLGTRLDQRFSALSEVVRDEQGRLASEATAGAIERVDGKIDGWSERLDGWGTRLEQRMERPRDAEVNMFKALAARLDAVSDRLAELPDAQHDARNFGALEARVNALLQRMDALAQANPDKGALDALRAQLGSIAWRIEQPAEPPAALTTLDARVQAMASRIEALSAANAEIATNIETMGARPEGEAVGLEDSIIERIGAQVETSVSRRLDELTEVLNRTTAPITELGPRLDALEETMGDAQVALVDTARSAAADVVSSLLENRADMMPAEAEAVAALDGDIRRLEELTVGNDERNNKTFDAVHETLLKIVDRLDQLDTMVARATEAPDPAVMAATHAALMQSNPAAPRSGGLMDRLRGRAAADKGEAATKDAPSVPPVEPEAREEDAESIFAALDPDTPLDPLTGEPRFDPAGIDATTGEPTVDSILANMHADGGDGDFADAARRASQSLDDAEFTGTLDGVAAKGRRGKALAKRNGNDSEAKHETKVGKSKANKGAANKGAADKGGSALARHRRPLLMAAAVAIAALIAMPQIKGTANGVMGNKATVAPVAADIAAPIETGEAAELGDAAIDAGDASIVLGEDVPLDAPAATVETTPAEADAAAASDAVEVEPNVDPIATQAVPDETDARAAIRDINEPVEMAEPVEATTPVASAPKTDVSGPFDAIALTDADGPSALRAAAKAGDARALHEIAGRIASSDPGRAFALYQAAAERGLAPAQYRLGQAYEKGYGTRVDLAAARQWYGVAAEAGNASAMHNLAVLYAMGAEGTRDVTLAGRWFTEAANLGVKDSQYNLGILHAQGSGVSEDLTESYKWFDAAAKAGDSDAAAKRDEVGGAMSAGQLAAAKSKAEAWQAKVPEVAANRVVVPTGWREAALKPEDMTRAVRNVQAILNRAGFDAGTADGVMGKKTRTAILEFQRAEGLKPTGEIDDALVKALLRKNEA